MIPNSEFHLTHISVVLITKEPILVWAIEKLSEQRKFYSTRQQRSQYIYQTTTTISRLWEAKSGHGHLTSSFQLLGE